VTIYIVRGVLYEELINSPYHPLDAFSASVGRARAVWLFDTQSRSCCKSGFAVDRPLPEKRNHDVECASKRSGRGANARKRSKSLLCACSTDHDDDLPQRCRRAAAGVRKNR